MIKGRLETEPQVEPGKPIKPRDVTGEAATVWTRVTKLLDSASMLTKHDGEVLARYCHLSAQWQAYSCYEPERLKVETVDDLRVINGHLDKLLKINDAMLKIEVQYGMTPASRPNVKRLEKPAHGNAKEKDKMRFFKAG